jgi:hypothetical protein
MIEIETNAYLTVSEAQAILRRPSWRALDSWMRRFNIRHPEAPIRRLPGLVARADLERAIRITTNQHTPRARRRGEGARG